MPKESKNLAWRDRKYGRVSGGDLSRLLAAFDEIWEERESFVSLKDNPEEWGESLGTLVALPNWATFYEIDFLKLVATLMVQTGHAEAFTAAAKDGVEGLLDFVESLPDFPPPSKEVLPACMAMIGNLEAISLYSRSMNDMIKAARGGDIEALGQAISVDAYIISFPIFLAGMRLDQFTGDARFTKEVMRAISGPHKKRYEYIKLRWAEFLLRDQGAFEVCTREDIYSLIVEHLKLYDPIGDKKDPKAGLFALFRKWQKQAGIQKPRFGFSGRKKA